MQAQIKEVSGNQLATAMAAAGLKTTEERSMIMLEREQKFVLMFECSKKEVLEGIQILPAGGGSASVKHSTNVQNFEAVKIDLNGFLSRLIVQSINVCEIFEGCCRVYVNCIAGTGEDAGFNHWGGGEYEIFVRRMLRSSWGKARLYESTEKSSLVLKKPNSVACNTKLRFVIKN